jgi:hypothetical protein
MKLGFSDQSQTRLRDSESQLENRDLQMGGSFHLSLSHSRREGAEVEMAVETL